MWPDYQWCSIRPGLLSPEECFDLVALAAAQPSVPSKMSNRDCHLFWLLPSLVREETSFKINRAVLDWNQTYQLSIGSPDFYQIARYLPGEYYDWHMDLGSGAMSLRKVSLCIELSPPGNGGGLEIFFGHGENQIPLSLGDSVIFPSWIIHRARTPTSGERWSLAAWFCGEEPLK